MVLKATGLALSDAAWKCTDTRQCQTCAHPNWLSTTSTLQTTSIWRGTWSEWCAMLAIIRSANPDYTKTIDLTLTLTLCKAARNLTRKAKLSCYCRSHIGTTYGWPATLSLPEVRRLAKRGHNPASPASNPTTTMKQDDRARLCSFLFFPLLVQPVRYWTIFPVTWLDETGTRGSLWVASRFLSVISSAPKCQWL